MSFRVARRAGRCLVPLLLAVAIPAAAQGPAATAGPCAAEPAAGARRIADGEVEIHWLADPAPLAAHRATALRLRLCPPDARLMAVDAWMPRHRHGMNYRPGVQAQGPAQWRAEGLLLHMDGDWELRFDVEHGGRRRVLVQPLSLP